jgi:hypothetical protein
MVLKKIYIPVQSTDEFPIHFISSDDVATYIDKYGDESFFESIIPKQAQVFSKKTMRPKNYEDDIISALLDATTDTDRIVILSKIYDIDPTDDNAEQLLSELRDYHARVFKGDTKTAEVRHLLEYIKQLERQTRKDVDTGEDAKKKKKETETKAKAKTEVASAQPVKIREDTLLFSQGSIANRLELSRYVPTNRKQFPSFIQMEFEPKLREKPFLPVRVWVPEHEQFADKTPFEQQKFVSYFLSEHTPYRGLLLYHGLGSGKSGASILIAEGFRDRRVAVLLPASLHNNYVSEIKKFGEAAYKSRFHWDFVELPYDAKKERVPEEVVLEFEKLGIDDDLLHSIIVKRESTYGIFMIDYSKSKPNVDTMTPQERRLLDKQIDAMIDYKYAILHYNAGIYTIPQILEKCLPRGTYRRILLQLFGVEKKTTFTQSSLSRIMNYVYDPANKIPNPFDNRVVIIDEVHNITSHLTGQSYTIGYIYEMIMRAKDVKLVFLSGTPVINTKYELALMYNMLHGLIREFTMPIRRKSGPGNAPVKKDDIEKILDASLYVDRYTIDTRSNTASVILVPTGFQNKYHGKTYQGLEKASEHLYDEQMIDRVLLEFDKGGYAVSLDAIEEKVYTIFPDILVHDQPEIGVLKKAKKTTNAFRRLYPNVMMGDRTLKLNSALEFEKNPVYWNTFKDRIQGYTSYYHEITGVSEETGSDLFPEKIMASGDEVETAMSNYQFVHYCTYRMHEQYLEELSEKSRRATDKDKKKSAFSEDSIAQSFRVFTRQIGLFVFPPNIERPRIQKVDYSREYTMTELSLMVKKVLTRYAKEDRYDKLQKLIAQLRGVNVTKTIEIVRGLYDISSKDIEEWKRVITSTDVNMTKLQFDKEEEKVDEASSVTESVIDDNVEVNVPVADQCDTEYGECDAEMKQVEEKYETEYIESIMRLSESNLKNAETLSDGGQSVAGMTLDVLSPKYVKMLTNINATPGLVLCYSQFRNIEGVATFARVLEMNGYKRLRITGSSASDKLRKGDLVRYTEGDNIWKTSRVRIMKEGTGVKYQVEGGKRFDREEVYPCKFALWTGTESQEEREKILQIYNDMSNMFGQHCLVLMITQSGAEGISLKNVRQVHVMEPYWNNVRVNQVIGRARRVESHVHLPKDQQNVKIFKYTIRFTPEQKDGTWLKKNADTMLQYDYSELMDFKNALDEKREKSTERVKQAVEEGKVSDDGADEKKKASYSESDKRDFLNAISKTITSDKFLTSDEELGRLSSDKERSLAEYIKMMKESSVDCHFNREANIRADPEYASSKCYVNTEGIQRNPYMYDYHTDSGLIARTGQEEKVEEKTVAEKGIQYVYKVFNYKNPSDPTKVLRLRVHVPEFTDIKDIAEGTDIMDETNKVVGKFVRANGKTFVRLTKRD